MSPAKRSKPPKFELRPGIENPDLWYPDRSNTTAWQRTRQIVLQRDDYTCIACGHRAMKSMNVHHLFDSKTDDLENLATLCVACHAVMHIGLNLQYKGIEIWETESSQVDIVRATRDGIRNGLALEQVNATFGLRPGKHPPASVKWANDLIETIGDKRRAALPKPLCAVFVKFKSWQL